MMLAARPVRDDRWHSDARFHFEQPLRFARGIQNPFEQLALPFVGIAIRMQPFQKPFAMLMKLFQGCGRPKAHQPKIIGARVKQHLLEEHHRSFPNFVRRASAGPACPDNVLFMLGRDSNELEYVVGQRLRLRLSRQQWSLHHVERNIEGRAALHGLAF